MLLLIYEGDGYQARYSVRWTLFVLAFLKVGKYLYLQLS